MHWHGLWGLEGRGQIGGRGGQGRDSWRVTGAGLGRRSHSSGRGVDPVGGGGGGLGSLRQSGSRVSLFPLVSFLFLVLLFPLVLPQLFPLLEQKVFLEFEQGGVTTTRGCCMLRWERVLLEVNG